MRTWKQLKSIKSIWYITRYSRREYKRKCRVTYEVHTISFATYFVWALLLIVHTWNSSPLRSNLLRLQCTCCTVPTTSGVMTSLLLVHLSSSLTGSLSSLNLLCHSETDARFMQDGPRAVWTISYVSVAFCSSLKQNFVIYRSSKASDSIFEIHQLWQSGFGMVYSNSCCSYWFKPEIMKNNQSASKMYSNNILNFQESTTILNAHTKKVWKLIICPFVFYW